MTIAATRTTSALGRAQLAGELIDLLIDSVGLELEPPQREAVILNLLEHLYADEQVPLHRAGPAVLPGS